jgi:hypothetical protein
MRNQTSIQEKGNLRISKTYFLAALVVAVSLAAACANSQAKDGAGAASNSQPTAAPTPIDVTTAPAITRNVQRDVEVVGSFAADEGSSSRRRPRANYRKSTSISAVMSRRARSLRLLTSVTRNSRSNRLKPRLNRRSPGWG